MRQKIMTALYIIVFLFLTGIILYLFSQNQALTLSLENTHTQINNLEDELALKNTALKEAQSHIAGLDLQLSELKSRNDSLEEEIRSLKKDLENAMRIKEEAALSHSDAQSGPEDTLTEKDLETMKEKVKNGEMNDFLKETIGSMNRAELMKLARDLGLLSLW